MLAVAVRKILEGAGKPLRLKPDAPDLVQVVPSRLLALAREVVETATASQARQERQAIEGGSVGTAGIPAGVTFMAFSTLEAAQRFKDRNGGWVFVSDDGAVVLWFDAAQFTPSRIMNSYITAGVSGRLV